MVKDFSGVTWAKWPMHGAVGAGRQDTLPVAPEEFTPTPAAFVNQEDPAEEAPDAGPVEPD
jgi:hypothetical protein